ncbi:CAP domain-containing protein [Lentibacillus sp. N15]|uniref:CAP domain-containing protein n=1 Tax=Lentibacillus songyuanensis TaxID=3136161 RepID=UPI0031BA580D
MLKKFGVVTAITTALVFGGALTSVDASASTDNSTNQSYNVHYTMNGGDWNNSSNLVNNYFHHFHCNWSQQGNHQQQAAPTKNGTQQDKTTEQPKQEQPKQTENNQASAEKQPAADKQEQQSQEKAQGLSQYEQQVVDLTNQEREKQGLSPLKADTELSKVAHEKSRDMSANNYFSHNSPTYGSPFDMMKSYGISYQSAGENIARGQQTPEEVVNAWMNSEGHRANILNAKFTHIGVGFVENGNYWTQEFIGK